MTGSEPVVLAVLRRQARREGGVGRIIERAGTPVIVFTADLLGGSNRETMLRERRFDTRTCTNCHQGGPPMPGISGRVNELRDNRRKPAIAEYRIRYVYPPYVNRVPATVTRADGRVEVA